MDIFIVIFLSVIGLFDSKIGWLSLWDEAILFLVLIRCAVGIVNNNNKIRFKNNSSTIILLITTITLIGLIGNVFHMELQSSWIAIFKDIIAFIKFPLVLTIMSSYNITKTKNRKIIVSFCKFYIVLLAIFALIGYFTDLGVYIDDYSKPFRTFEFYYSHCTFMVSTVLCLVAVLIADGRKRNRKFIFLGCLVMMMSQRTKAVFISLMTVILMLIGTNKISLFLIKTKEYLVINKKRVIPMTIVLSCIAWLIARNRINLFWQYGFSSARPALYMTGILIAMDYFPLGSGFATFASSISGEYYSGVYAKYGIDNVLGLTRNSYSFMADAYLPYIYGQFGFVGFVLYSATIIKLMKNSITNLKDYNSIAAILVMWMYLLFASTAETIFTNSTAVQFALFIAIIKSLDYKSDLIRR